MINRLRHKSANSLYPIDFQSSENKTPFFLGYSILFTAAAGFHCLKTVISVPQIDKLRCILRTMSQDWELCNTMKPKAFVEPLLRRLWDCLEMTKIGMRLTSVCRLGIL